MNNTLRKHFWHEVCFDYDLYFSETEDTETVTVKARVYIGTTSNRGDDPTTVELDQVWRLEGEISNLLTQEQVDILSEKALEEIY